MSFSDRATYFYIKKIKKWMFCPNCKEGKMKFNKKSSSWVCEDCEYSFTEQYFLDDCVFWFCDECDTYLNNQEGFDKHSSKHICRNCGYENDITENNIKGCCSDCGKLLPDPDATLCENCRQMRKEKAKQWLITAGEIVAGIAVVAGAAALAISTDEDNKNMNYAPSTIDGDNEENTNKENLICCECGHEWSMELDSDGLFNGYGCPPCPNCFSGRGVSPNDYGDFKCIWCGNEFRRYGNGGLHLGMIPKCPDCGGPCTEN